ncbi:MAG: hypothetical protein JKY22_12310 [Flavobacteriaceae bacterium]|nr:hypothetical protein [Flavobacteriaceae bacterium]
MINWIKKEYKAFCTSRTIRLAYAQGLANIIGGAMTLLPSFEGYFSPQLFIVVNAVFAMAFNVLRKVTDTALGDK